MRRLSVVLALTLGGLIGPPGGAQEPPQQGPTVEQLRDELDRLRSEMSERIATLEARIAELEGGAETAPAAPAPETEDSLAALREAARQAAAEVATPEPATPAEPAFGKERNLSQLNPEISATGIVEAFAGDGREDFQPTEFELDAQSALDPYSRMRLTLAFSEEEGVDVEEGFIQYSGLPTGLDLKFGKFRQRFGALNQQHLHALPQNDYPLALASYFGEEGLAQTGVALGWVLPHGWASSNEVIVEVTDGSNDTFGGEDFDRLVPLVRLKSFWDLTPATWFEWNLSGITGRAAGDLDSTVLGTDFTLHWQPPARAKYRELTWRTELLRSERDDPDTGLTQEAWGGYSYLEGLVARNWYLGVRYDMVEDPLTPDDETWGVFPYVTWWQSEFVRLRAQYGLTEGPDGERSNLFGLQATWAAGPHKHETY
ncbi:MAG: hypothetical protein R2991_03300 [Thermoanaerobaculia bacterium]